MSETEKSGASLLEEFKVRKAAEFKKELNEYHTEFKILLLGAIFFAVVLVVVVLIVFGNSVPWYGVLASALFGGLSILGVLLVLLLPNEEPTKTTVENFSWWKNITDDDPQEVKSIVSWVLEVAESEFTLNREQRSILNSVQASALKSLHAGEWPTTTHKDLGVRALEFSAKTGRRLPTTK